MKTLVINPGQVALIMGMGTDGAIQFQMLHEDDTTSTETVISTTKLLFLMSGLIEIFKNEPQHVALSASKFYDSLNEVADAKNVMSNEENKKIVGGVLHDLESREGE